MILRVVPSRDRALWATLKVHPEVRVRAGKAAWRCGEAPALCVWIREGAGVLRSDEGQAVGLAGAGDLVGLGSGVRGPGSVRELVALRDSLVVPVPTDRVEGAVARSAATLPEVFRSLVEGEERARALAGGAGRAPARARLARALREAAVRIGEEDPAGKGTRVEGVPHRLLAEWAGLHRSTVTTVLNEWLYDGILWQRGRALVVPPWGGLPGEGVAPR